jgi:hypothetical protein
MLSGAGRNVRFRKERNMLTTFVHGDGSMNQFRFAVQDSLGFEVSKWFTVDWIGWRQVDWDAELDSLGTWNGNGNLDGELRFDSFQMRYLPGTSVASGQLFFDQLQLATKMVTSVESDGREGPAEFSLEQNYPNPFNPSTRIAFSVQGSGFTSLKVFDLLGREVATLVNENLTAGSYRVKFDASGLASGVFFYRLVAGGQALTRKMVVAK